MSRNQFPALLTASICSLVLGLGFGASALAEDLSDNEVCLECHAGEPHSAPEGSDVPRIHTDDGGFVVEDHEMWSCIDCHENITEVPHPEDIVGTGTDVNCENCHEGTPGME